MWLAWLLPRVASLGVLGMSKVQSGGPVLGRWSRRMVHGQWWCPIWRGTSEIGGIDTDG